MKSSTHSITRRQMLALGVAGAIGAPWVRAESTYPSHTVRVVLPYFSGGPNDIATRILTEELSHAWNVPVIVLNKPGGNGTLGTLEVKSAAADGYTVLSGATFVVLNPLIYPDCGYTAQDFVPIAEFGSPPNVIVVREDARWKTLDDLIKDARARPRALKSPHAGVGSSIQLGLSLFLKEAGVQVVVVPYKGSIAYVPDLLGGRLDFAFLATQLALPQVQAGKLRVLATVSQQRLPQLPQVRTLSEAGFPGSVVLPWSGLFVRAGTPRPVVDRLREGVATALRVPEVRERYARMYAEVPQAPLAFAQLVDAERTRWAHVVQTHAVEGL
ncbi:Bug family tripartite tricarboxylate transporter substrate binding protein [Paraburkholderia tropica]|uniref:Bug family tripartite tricarboxylate transporter substrate binding protein n=1 Tax=Paraburkholderia tropica TaxID=92647 RepID=UPI002AB63237|nr:tripartite tricarboxylate transporter substrate binding protein [Paraburkholderia tropica]